MGEPATTLLFGLDKLDMLLRMYTEGFTPEHWRSRAGELHSAHWILAHLVLDIHQAAGRAVVFGEELDKTLDYGAPVEEDRSQWPTPEALLTEWGVAHASLVRVWGERDEAAWLAPVKENRLKAMNRAQMDMFILEHAVYHVGQLGALRRVLGLPGVV